MKKLYISLTSFLITLNILSQNTSMKFVELYPSARMEAVSVSSLSGDSGCIFKNPAGLYDINYNLFSFSYNEYIQQMKYNFFNYTIPKKHYKLSFGFSSLYSDKIEAREGTKDLDLEYVNLYQITSPDYYYDMISIQTGCGISKYINSEIIFGSTGKILFEKIENISAYSFAFDFGFNYTPHRFEKINFGLLINNLGIPVKYIEEIYPLPLKSVLSCSFRNNNLYLASEIGYPFFEPKSLYVSFGSEFVFLDYLFLRAGYKYKPYASSLENIFAGCSCGVGVDFYGIKLDYSLASFGELGISYKITFSCEIEKVVNFYRFLRKKVFSKEIKDTKKVFQQPYDVLHSKPIEIVKEKETDNNLVPHLKTGSSLKQFVFNTKLISFDSVNKLFIYKLELSTPVYIDDSTNIQELSFEIVKSEPLKESLSLDISVSTQPFETNSAKCLDFTEFKKIGLTNRYNLKLVSKIDNVECYNYQNNDWVRIDLTKTNTNYKIEYTFTLEDLEKLLIVIKNE